MTNPQQNFLEDTINKIPKIHEAISVLNQEPNNKTCLNILYMFFHTIYATGSTIGVHEVLEVAKSMEDRLSERIYSVNPLSPPDSPFYKSI